MPSCWRCGRDNPEGSRFCNSCGAALASGGAVFEERKIVSVLFADITGSTALGERLDAEALKEVMTAGDPRPGEALATGDAVNAAARLEQAAEPGQVLVSERTAAAARGFRFLPPRDLELRGKAETLRALELVAEQPVAEGFLSGSRVPLVGRRRELELLTTMFHRTVEERRPHLG